MDGKKKDSLMIQLVAIRKEYLRVRNQKVTNSQFLSYANRWFGGVVKTISFGQVVAVLWGSLFALWALSAQAYLGIVSGDFQNAETIAKADGSRYIASILFVLALVGLTSYCIFQTICDSFLERKKSNQLADVSRPWLGLNIASLFLAVFSFFVIKDVVESGPLFMLSAIFGVIHIWALFPAGKHKQFVWIILSVLIACVAGCAGSWMLSVLGTPDLIIRLAFSYLIAYEVFNLAWFALGGLFCLSWSLANSKKTRKPKEPNRENLTFPVEPSFDSKERPPKEKTVKKWLLGKILVCSIAILLELFLIVLLMMIAINVIDRVVPCILNLYSLIMQSFGFLPL